MRLGDTIHNLDGQPFRTSELAQRMSQLLSSETGLPYVVDSWIGGGFVVRRQTPVNGSSAPLVVDAVSPARHSGSTEPTQRQASPSVRTQTFHPAVLRSNLHWLPVWVFAGLLSGFADVLLEVLLTLLRISPAQLGVWLAWIVEAMTVAGRFWLAAITVLLWTEWASQRFIVSASGIEARSGIFARRTQQLRYGDIRSVSLEQTFWERLFNYGSLDFTSAGTQSTPLRFDGIARPARIQALIQARMDTSRAD